MQEREFQNMFLFSPGFEAATLKVPQGNEPELGGRKQIIGFAKFRSRLEALQARDILSGKRVDAERGCVIKAEMAKKNLLIKKMPIMDGSFANSSMNLAQALTPNPIQGVMKKKYGNTAFDSFFPVNSGDQNPPCNTLYVGNLPISTMEEELRQLFTPQPGYKRLCFRMKPHSGPMCFIEFDDIQYATYSLQELQGHLLSNSVKGGIRLSYSKNPLGVRA
ncbi:hypothetical protein K493DRAFT_274749 [Basidiobolus meristosporus CBS 931.73]|uniref:RRM domain-containing protein n=1 Tax=Basidiobolus meristosporus CBS 931.73 TaxID=1314790 RepID=A0A1Y1Z6H1_9FUNG|nr:hypothetical protein K493DRAFT_274749 [Basidiobolus meristosporus CBS 931.73]|eukprot:ORY05878.1 hypothetical protein K493DRAFT_274749 [Basidiobolus meristosporus CBS 931.73]